MVINLEVFPLRSRTRQQYPLLPLPFSILLEVLANAIRTANKRYTDWDRRRLSLFTGMIIIPIENMKESTITPQIIIARLQNTK